MKTSQGDNDNRKNGMDPNVIAMPTLAERDRMRREKEKLERARNSASEPMINIPPITKWLIGFILAIHILVGVALNPEQGTWVIEHFGFTPEKFHDGNIDIYALSSLITHMFLHGGWMHVVMNLFMLAAFGSGVEKWLGSRRMLILFFASGLLGVAAHYILNTASAYPMIGASGGLSGLFAASIVMINKGQREMGGRIGILPFALLWIALSIGFGMMGAPDGSAIAWAAHVGGFLGGFLVLKLMKI